MRTKNSSIPLFFHNKRWKKFHSKILKALNEGAKTYNEIFMKTNITYRAITRHLKEIIECPNCNFFNDKTVFCSNCGFRLIESYG